MPFIEYPTIEGADTRSAEFWAEVRREGWHEDNVTQYLYGRRQRMGDPEADEGLPETGDYFIYIPDDAMRLDGLVLQEALTLAEYEAIISVYDVWSGDAVAYYDDEEPEHEQSVVRYDGQLWKCLQSHTSQVGWTPTSAGSLWTLAVPPDVIPEWVQPTGGHDSYNAGDLVTHDGYIWQSEIDANVWEPGSTGAESLWTQLEAV